MLRRASPRATDILVVLVATGLQLAGARPGPPAEPPDVFGNVVVAVLAAAAVAVQGGSLVWRRTRPVLVLGVCVAAYLINAAAVPGAPPYAAWFALYAAVLYTQPGRRAAYAVTAGAGVLVAALVASALVYTETAVVPLALVTVIVALVAAAIRARRAQLEALRDRAAALERAAASTAARAAAEERLRIARDLHDLVGHGLSSIAVQSSTARLALDKGRLEQARAALAAVESSSRAALGEMRQLLGLLRAGDRGEYAPAPGLADLPRLIDGVRAQDTSVTFSAGEVGPLPTAVSLCVYRVVQEALTNAVKHAPDNAVTVDIAAADGAVLVTVDDHPAASPPVRRDSPAPRHPAPGVPAPEQAAAPTGHGLAGMRERVSALGGELTSGPAGDHPGWRVQARIPYRGEEPP